MSNLGFHKRIGKRYPSDDKKYSKCNDEYCDPNVDNKLPKPQELTDDKLHIKMLQEDLTRAEQLIGSLRSQLQTSKKIIHKLRYGEVKKEYIRTLPSEPEVRRANKLTIKELAKLADIDYQTLCKREVGTVPWTEDAKAKVCIALGVSEVEIDWNKNREAYV